MGGFRDFLFRGNLVQLAVAVIIGTSFGALVTAFTTGLITPLLGQFGEQPKFEDLAFKITEKGAAFRYGLVIDAMIAFFITALVLYYIVVVPSEWLMARVTKAAESDQRPCPECFSSIKKQATRCAFCTSVVAPVPVEVEKEVEEKAGDAAEPV